MRWLCILLLAPLDAIAQRDFLSAVSFRPPFSTFDSEGKRLIPNFETGGHVDLNENFIRLTPDRASKRGWIWSKNALDADQWSATLRFRVSGQGKQLFGDGFALWFTQHRYHIEGPEHGFTNDFVGFGVLFDTFRNSESKRPHRDVALLISNGKLSDADPSTIVGCDGDFRFWEGRDDFSVRNKSVVRITLVNDRVSVSLDAQDSGEFSSCVTDVPLSLPAGWHRQGYFGITATTGQLADNHDVLSLLVSTQIDKVSAENALDEDAVSQTGNPQLDGMVAFTVHNESQPLLEKMNHLHHHLEHQLSAIQDSLQSTLRKLNEAETAALARIEQVEQRVSSAVDMLLFDKVDSALDASIGERVAAVEDSLSDKLANKIVNELDDSVKVRVDDASRSWMLPFSLLLIVIGGLAAFAFKKYRTLLKTHLL